MATIHATCIALDGHGIVLRGPSGVGKSDLAIRMIDDGAVLVADDRVGLSVKDGLLWAWGPPALAGLIEARGIGPIQVPWVARAPVDMIVDLRSTPRIERLPEPGECHYFGIARPLIQLAPFEASAPAKLRLAVASLTRRLRATAS
jgi:HPr kinase/phosphorylase